MFLVLMADEAIGSEAIAIVIVAVKSGNCLCNSIYLPCEITTRLLNEKCEAAAQFRWVGVNG